MVYGLAVAVVGVVAGVVAVAGAFRRAFTSAGGSN